MQWLSDTCVLLDSQKLINASYCQYQAAAGQFDLEKPYQTGPQYSSTSVTCDPSEPSCEGPDKKQPTDIEHNKPPRSEPDIESPPTGSVGDSKHTRKRKRVQLDPQRHLRQQEANARHDSRQPVLLSAHTLLQHYISSGNEVMPGISEAAHTLPRVDSPPSSCTYHSTEELDLCALHELKYTLHPKFKFDSTRNTNQQEPAVNLFDAVHSNSHESERLATAYQSQVLIPPHSNFLISDVKRLQPLLSGMAIAVAYPPCHLYVVLILTVSCSMQSRL